MTECPVKREAAKLPRPEVKRRQRVPITCTNCKRRKVKCDKLRPCSGCIRNNVAELCTYTQPAWAGPAEEVSKASDLDKLRSEYEATILAKDSEIRRLQAMLSVSQNHGKTANLVLVLAPKNPHPITVLRKVMGDKARPAEVVGDELLTVSGFDRASQQPSVSLGSWLNSIKMDPQMTALWYRITSLQKQYHIFKTTVAERADAACGHRQCPVVACEFDMEELDLEQDLEPVQENGEVKAESFDNYTPATNGYTAGMTNYTAVANYALGANTAACPYNHKAAPPENAVLGSAHYAVQNVHGPRFRAAFGGLTPPQIAYLVDYYYSSPAPCPESRRILDPFRLRIQALASNLANSCDLTFLMLALVVEEALCSLDAARTIPQHIQQQIATVFAPNSLHILRQSVSLLEAVEISLASPPSRPSLAYVTVCVAMLNRQVVLHRHSPIKKEGSHLPRRAEAVAVKIETDSPLAARSPAKCPYPTATRTIPGRNPGHHSSFSHTLLLTLRALAAVPLNVDPAQIVLASPSPGLLLPVLAYLVCQLWSDVLRLLFHTTFRLLGTLTHHTAELDVAIENVLHSASVHRHVAYIHSHEASAVDLAASLQIYQAMADAARTLRGGMRGNCSISTEDLGALAQRCYRGAQDPALRKLPRTRAFEATLLALCMDVYLLYVMFLQHEDDGDADAAGDVLLALFAKSCGVQRCLQSVAGAVSQISGPPRQHLVDMAAEKFSKMAHLLAALLVRLRSVNSESPASALNYNLGPTAIPVAVASKNELLQETDTTMKTLEQLSPTSESVRSASKIWRFYMTFVSNPQKLDAEATAKLHAKAFSARREMACPAMKDAGFNIKGLDPNKCPVLHPGPTLPGRDWSPSPAPDQKRICPLDQTSRTFLESNVRSVGGRKVGAKNGARALTPRNSTAEPAVGLPIALDLVAMLNVPVASDGIDWDSLPAFDFDNNFIGEFLGIEGLFQ